MNTTRKGSVYEHKSRVALARAGYTCIRSSRSASLWDVWGYSPAGFVLCQVKYGDWPGQVEMEALRLEVVPANCLRLVHRWRRGRDEPDVRVVT